MTRAGQQLEIKTCVHHKHRCLQMCLFPYTYVIFVRVQINLGSGYGVKITATLFASCEPGNKIMTSPWLTCCSKLAGKRHGMFSRLQDTKKLRVATDQGSGKPASSAQTVSNNFSNDGSFMEQFYKMQGIKSELKWNWGNCFGFLLIGIPIVHITISMLVHL